MQAVLVLEDGSVFRGRSFGAQGARCGEIVFNTSMSGYQEIITDPSYKGQIVAMTYPLIGNYGINEEDAESGRPFVEGFVVKECSRIASNWRSGSSLPDYLCAHGIPAVEGVDTRALTLRIREAGALKAVIAAGPDCENVPALLEKARSWSGLVGIDLVKEVSCREAYDWNDKGKYRVAVLDCGVKYNILRILAGLSCRVRVFPAGTSAADILAWKPDGIMLSNGPGDPAAVTYVIDTVRELASAGIPMFGICLGNQMLGLAFGGRTYKLKFGHHGANHPVKDLNSGKVAITVQNHGFCVDMKSLNGKELQVTHINLNDDTHEGMKHRKLPVFSVQFHPEASPGPHDAAYLFASFVDSAAKHKYRGKRNA